MRDEAGLFLCLRRLRVLLRQSRLTRPDARSRAARAVLAWALLAGLFFMHGVPSSGGCQDGAPMASVTASVTPVLPGAMPAHKASLVSAAERGSCCAGMCSSRQPRQGPVGASAASLAAAVSLPVTAALAADRLAAAPRTTRPPGRPGLPLPLFLGVSRT